MNKSLKHQTVKSVIWSAIERFSTQGIQFLLTIVIARLVSPSDYGLIAMLSVFIAIAQTFIDSGFSNALIQKIDRTETDFSTVFYFNIVVGIVAYLLLYFGSGYIAQFYNEPQLDLLTKIVGLNVIVNSFSVVQRAKLTITLNFKKQAVVALISVVISGVIGIYMAYMGYGVWAIVFQYLLNNFFNTLLLWVFVGWFPKLNFSFHSFRVLFGFGSKLLASGLLHTIYVNLYNIIIGKFFTPIDLGYYNRAYTIAYFPSTNISNVITRAVYPILCSIQDDNARLRASFLQCIRITSYVIFPLLVSLIVLSKPFVILLLTEKWLPIVPLLQALCFAYMLIPIIDMNNSFITAKGRTDYFFKAEIIKKIIAVIILVATMGGGIQIMCYGLIVYSFFDFYIISRYTSKVICCSFSMQIKALLPIVYLNLLLGAGICTLSFFINGDALLMLIGCIIGFFLYFVFSYLFKFKELNILLTIMKN